jgi:hypothetical protein
MIEHDIDEYPHDLNEQLQAIENQFSGLPEELR